MCAGRTTTPNAVPAGRCPIPSALSDPSPHPTGFLALPTSRPPATWALYDRTDNAGKRTYVMPAGMVNTCGFGGLAWTPGVQTWLPSDAYNGIQSKQATFHEMIHTFGLGHSRYNGIEYGDSTSPMGQGLGCPSAPEMRRLRWATPLADFAITTLTPGLYRRYTLPALASKAAQTFLRITTTTQ